MALAKKKKTHYVCQQCGYDTVQWLGKCPGCGAWNTMVEEVVPEEPKGLGSNGIRLGLSDAEAPKPIGEVVTEDLPRFSTGSPELDRVLGGGVIPGSMVLIVGDPGVGKSSLPTGYMLWLKHYTLSAKRILIPSRRTSRT